MDQFELENLLSVGQDPEYPRIVVDKALAGYHPDIKVEVPTAAEILFAEINGQSYSDFRADSRKALSYSNALDQLSTLSQATDMDELEKAASVHGTSIRTEMAVILRKAVAESPTEVGDTPTARPNTGTTKPNYSPARRLS